MVGSSAKHAHGWADAPILDFFVLLCTFLLPLFPGEGGDPPPLPPKTPHTLVLPIEVLPLAETPGLEDVSVSSAPEGPSGALDKCHVTKRTDFSEFCTYLTGSTGDGDPVRAAPELMGVAGAPQEVLALRRSEVVRAAAVRRRDAAAAAKFCKIHSPSAGFLSFLARLVYCSMLTGSSGRGEVIGAAAVLCSFTVAALLFWTLRLGTKANPDSQSGNFFLTDTSIHFSPWPA